MFGLFKQPTKKFCPTPPLGRAIQLLSLAVLVRDSFRFALLDTFELMGTARIGAMS